MLYKRAGISVREYVVNSFKDAGRDTKGRRVAAAAQVRIRLQAGPHNTFVVDDRGWERLP